MNVVQYLARRLLGLAVVLWLTSTTVFILLRVIPGDPVQIVAGLGIVDPATLHKLRSALGLDQPIAVQYAIWLAHLLRGDLGVSLRSGTPVVSLIAQALPITLELAALALLAGITMSVLLGVAAARRRRRIGDLLITSGALVGISLPSFVLALLSIYLVSVKLRLLPTGGFVPLSQDPAQNLKLMILPAITLGTGTAGILVRMMRRNLIDVSGEDYIRTARAKGLSPRRVIYRHAMRNAVIPYVTIAGLEAGALLSGAVITERIFAIPGMGQLMMLNIAERDYPVVQGCVLVVAALYVAVNFVIDLLYAWLDPRMAVR